MSHESCNRPHYAWTVPVAFAALAIVAGPVTTYASPSFFLAMHWQTFAGGAISCALVGTVLLLLSVVRRQPWLGAQQWLALLFLLLPQWIVWALSPPFIRSIPWLHETPWGVFFLMSLAAPVWLALLSALDLVSVEVPRAVVAAAIAGMGATCLVIPTDAFHVAANQVPMLLIEVVVNISIVFTWAYAAPRLRSAEMLSTVASFLLLTALGDAALWLLFERTTMQPVDWRVRVASLLVEPAVLGCSWCLWFWLLKRMTLAAFAMHALAAWTASMLPGLVLFGFLNWRMDIALAIALAALVVGLRSRSVEEQPTSLGLRSP